MKNIYLKLLFIPLLTLLLACETLVDSESSTLSEIESTNEVELRPGTQTIADIVVASASDGDEPQFTLLLAALEYTGLTGVFTGGDQYTVFAPTDAAFEGLVEFVSQLLDSEGLEIFENEGAFAAVDYLLGDGTVENVLLYHVAEGRRAANSVVPRNARQDRKIQTLLGVEFSVNSSLGITAVGNTATIVDANISASNGIIHVIDTVILPIEL